MPYLTVEEMRRNPGLIEKPGRDAKGGTRFEESTEPPLALKYFPKDGKILECGPVFGPFTKFLQEEGYENIHALDFVDVLTYPDRKRLTFHEIDFNTEQMPYPEGFFDGVAAWGLGEHLENPFHFGREVRRVLKPGGIFIFSLPNALHIMSRLLFLKKGMLPRWNETNNHISILPKGVFDKTILRYFDLVEKIYIRPRVDYLFFRKLSSWLPANEWFGNYVVYILKPR